MMGRRAKQNEGFVLVLVLWGLAILSLIATALVAETRYAAQAAAARLGNTQATLLAMSGVERAFMSIDGPPGENAWPEDGTPVDWSFAGGRIAISIQDEAGKVDALNAPELMLAAALDHAGISRSRQKTIMGELREVHFKAELKGGLVDIASLDELAEVTSLSRDEIVRLRPVLTLRNGLAGFDPQVARADAIGLLPGADPITVAVYLDARKHTIARADAAGRPESPAPAFTLRSPRGTFTIRAEACTEGGYLAVREAVVRRVAPGQFARLELREPIEPQLIAGCRARPSASRHS